MAIALAHILDEIPAEGLSLDELTHAATRVLQELGITSGDARTSASIDVRTVRFYQTLGILPKPAYEGRCAVYSLTHVVRVVAAKHFQQPLMTHLSKRSPLHSVQRPRVPHHFPNDRSPPIAN